MSDFLDNLEKETDNNDLKELKALCDELKETQKNIAYYEEELKKIKQKELNLSREDIPGILNKNGLSELKLDTGEKVIVSDKIAVSIPTKDVIKRNKSFKWLIEQGGQNIIKKTLTIEDPENHIIEYLKIKGIIHENKLNIPSQTLKAWFRQKLGMNKNSLQELEVTDIPDCFNIFVFQETKIK